MMRQPMHVGKKAIWHLIVSRWLRLLHEIEDWYGVRIQLRNKKLANDLLTGTFYNESLESVLSSLKMQYKFNYHTDNGTIIIE